MIEDRVLDVFGAEGVGEADRDHVDVEPSRGREGAGGEGPELVAGEGRALGEEGDAAPALERLADRSDRLDAALRRRASATTTSMSATTRGQPTKRRSGVCRTSN
ncbi:MAG: hypothetical protein R3B09_15500 [Nannocystaceae bacterium]